MWKFIEVHKNQLATHQDRWNACIEAVTENSIPPDQGTPKTAWFAYSYFFEMESGGHEAYFYHLDQVIKEYGDERFLQDTEKALQTIGADQHAAIVRQHGKSLWDLYLQVEEQAQPEELFYEELAVADTSYYACEPSLQEYLETLCEENYQNLMTVLD